MLTVYFLSVLSLNNPRAVPRRPDSARKKDWPRAGTKREGRGAEGGGWRRQRPEGGGGGGWRTGVGRKREEEEEEDA